MEYKAALEKRAQLADKIKTMADKFEANGQEWTNGGDQSRFEGLVAEHKSQLKIINKHESAMAVAQKAAADGFGNGNRRGSVLFQAVDGSQIRGLKFGETFRPESATGFETEDEPAADYGDFLFFSMTGRQPASMQDVDIRNVATTPDSAGGFNVDSVLSSQVIEVIRPPLMSPPGMENSGWHHKQEGNHATRKEVRSRGDHSEASRSGGSNIPRDIAGTCSQEDWRIGPDADSLA